MTNDEKVEMLRRELEEITKLGKDLGNALRRVDALEKQNERLRGALQECRDVLSESIMYLPEPAQAENAIAYVEKLLGSIGEADDR